MTGVNFFEPADNAFAQAKRAADPVWRAAQVEKNEAASARFAEYRASIGLPLIRSPTMRVVGD